MSQSQDNLPLMMLNFEALDKLGGWDGISAPTLVVAIQGAMDAGSAGETAAEYLLSSLDSTRIATFNSDLLYDFRSRRPTITFTRRRFSSYVTPGLVIDRLTDDEGRPFLLLHGNEPDFRWQAVCEQIEQLLGDLGVEAVFFANGISWAVPHTRPSVVLLRPPASEEVELQAKDELFDAISKVFNPGSSAILTMVNPVKTSSSDSADKRESELMRAENEELRLVHEELLAQAKKASDELAAAEAEVAEAGEDHSTRQAPAEDEGEVEAHDGEASQADSHRDDDEPAAEEIGHSDEDFREDFDPTRHGLPTGDEFREDEEETTRMRLLPGDGRTAIFETSETFHMPGTLSMVLEVFLSDHDYETLGIAAQVPHYISQGFYPRAAADLVRHISHFGSLSLPMGELEVAAKDVAQDLDRQVSESPEATQLVSALEQAYDAFAGEHGPGADGSVDVPSAEEIGAAAEAFLAEQLQSEFSRSGAKPFPQGNPDPENSWQAEDNRDHTERMPDPGPAAFSAPSAAPRANEEKNTGDDAAHSDGPENDAGPDDAGEDRPGEGPVGEDQTGEESDGE